MKTPDGMVYEGDFEGGLPHGKVILCWLARVTLHRGNLRSAPHAPNLAHKTLTLVLVPDFSFQQV